MRRAADAALQIELALREAGLWHEQAPTPAAMASRTPFCADTLGFTQWLQFVFLPRVHMLIESNQPLPQSSNITAMAEESLPEVAGKPAVLTPIRAFDALIEEQTRD